MERENKKIEREKKKGEWSKYIPFYLYIRKLYKAFRIKLNKLQIILSDSIIENVLIFRYRRLI